MAARKQTVLEFIMTSKNGKAFMNWLQTEAKKSSDKMANLRDNIKDTVDKAKNLDSSIKNKQGLLAYKGDNDQIKRYRQEVLDFDQQIKMAREDFKMLTSAIQQMPNPVGKLDQAMANIAGKNLNELRQAIREWKAMLGNIGDEKNAQRDLGKLKEYLPVVQQIEARIKELEKGMMNTRQEAEAYLKWMEKGESERAEQLQKQEAIEKRLVELNRQITDHVDKVNAATGLEGQKKSELLQLEGEINAKRIASTEAQEQINANDGKITEALGKQDELQGKIERKERDQIQRLETINKLRKAGNEQAGQAVFDREAAKERYRAAKDIRNNATAAIQEILGYDVTSENITSDLNKLKASQQIYGKISSFEANNPSDYRRNEWETNSTAAMNKQLTAQQDILNENIRLVGRYKEQLAGSGKSMPEFKVPDAWKGIMSELENPFNGVDLSEKVLASLDNSSKSLIERVKRETQSIATRLRTALNSGTLLDKNGKEVEAGQYLASREFIDMKASVERGIEVIQQQRAKFIEAIKNGTNTERILRGIDGSAAGGLQEMKKSVMGNMVSVTDTNTGETRQEQRGGLRIKSQNAGGVSEEAAINAQRFINENEAQINAARVEMNKRISADRAALTAIRRKIKGDSSLYTEEFKQQYLEFYRSLGDASGEVKKMGDKLRAVIAKVKSKASTDITTSNAALGGHGKAGTDKDGNQISDSQAQQVNEQLQKRAEANRILAESETKYIQGQKQKFETDQQKYNQDTQAIQTLKAKKEVQQGIIDTTKAENDTLKQSVLSDQQETEMTQQLTNAKRALTRATNERKREEATLESITQTNTVEYENQVKELLKLDTIQIRTADDIQRYIQQLKTNRGALAENSEEYRKQSELIHKMELEYSKFVTDMGGRMGKLKEQTTPTLQQMRKHFELVTNSVHSTTEEIDIAKGSIAQINQQIARNNIADARAILSPAVAGAGFKNLSTEEVAKNTQILKQNADAANLNTTERRKLNEQIMKGEMYLQKVSNGDNLARMTAQYKYLTSSQKNLSQMSDDAMRKQQQFWLQQSTLVEAGSKKEAQYLERYRKTTEAINERVARQQRAAFESASTQVSELNQKKVADITREEMALTKQVLEYKWSIGKASDDEKNRLMEIRKLEMEGANEQKMRVQQIQRGIDATTAAKLMQKNINDLEKDELILIKQALEYKEYNNKLLPNEERYLARIRKMEFERTQAIRMETAELQRQAEANLVKQLSTKLITDLTREEVALTKQVLEHKELVGSITVQEEIRLAGIRALEFDRTAKVKERAAEMQKEHDLTLAEEAAMKIAIGNANERASVDRQRLELAKQVYSQIVATGQATADDQLLLRAVLSEEQQRLENVRQYTAEATKNANELRAIDIITKGVNHAEKEELDLAKKVYEQKVMTGTATSDERQYLIDILRDEERRLQLQKEITHEAHNMDVARADSILRNPLAHTAQEVEQATRFAKDYLQVNKQNNSTSQGLAKSLEICTQEQKKFNEESKKSVMRDKMASLNELGVKGLMEQVEYWKKVEQATQGAIGKTNEYNEAIMRRQIAEGRLRTVSMDKVGISTAGGSAMMSVAQSNGAATLLHQIEQGSIGSLGKMKEVEAELKVLRGLVDESKAPGAIRLIDEGLAKLKLDMTTLDKNLMSIADAEQRVAELGKAGAQTTSLEVDKLSKSLKAGLEYYTEMGDNGGVTRMRKALADLTVSADRLGVSTKAIGKAAKASAVDEETLARLMKDPSKEVSLKKLKDAYNALKQSIDNAADTQKRYNEVAGGMRNIDAQIQRIQKNIHSSESGLTKFIQGVKQYAMFYFGTMAIMMRIQSVFSKNKEMSDSIANVAKVANASTAEVNNLVTNIQKINTRTATSELMKMAEQAAKLGIYTRAGAEGVEEFVRAADKITKTLGEDIGGADAVADLVKLNDLINGEGGSLNVSLNKLGSAILAVGNNSAASYGHVVEFLRQTGAAGSVVNLTVQQLTALGATFSSLGAKMDQSATSINKMMVGIQKNTFAVAKSVGLSAVEMQKQLAAGDSFGAFLNVLDRIKDLQDAGENVSTVIGNVLKAMGGRQNTQMVTAMSLLVQNTARLREELGYASEAYEEGTLMTKEYMRVQNTLAGQMDKVGKAFTDTFTNPAVVAGLQGLIHMIGSFVSTLLSLPGLLVMCTMYFGKLVVGFRTLYTEMQASMIGVSSFKAILSGLVFAMTGVITFIPKFIIAMRGVTMSLGGVQLAAGLASNSIVMGFRAMWAGIKAIPFIGWVMAIIGVLALLKDKLFEPSDAELTKKAFASAGNAAEVAGAKMRRCADDMETQYNAMKKLEQEYAELRGNTGKTIEQLNEMVDQNKKLTKEESDQVKKKEELTEQVAKYNTALSLFNKQYSQYLGFQITDLENTNLLIHAKEKLAAALQKEAYERALEDRKEAIVQKYAEDLDTDSNDLMTDLNDMNRRNSLSFGGSSQYVDVNDMHTEILKVAAEMVDKALKEGKTKWDNSIAKNVADKLDKEFADVVLKDFWHEKWSDFDSNLANIEEYTKELFEQNMAFIQAERAFSAQIQQSNESIAESDKKITEDRNQNLEKYIQQLQSGSESIESLMKSTKGKVLKDFKDIVKQQENIYIQSAGNVTKSFLDNLKLYQGYMGQFEEYNKKMLRESVWGADAKDLNSMGAEQIKKTHDTLNAASQLIKDGTNIDEIANVIAPIVEQGTPMAKFRDALLEATIRAKSEGKTDSEIAELQRNMIDEQDELVKARAESIHVNLSGNLQHPNHSRRKEDHDFEGAIAELDRYYKEQETHFEHQLAMEEISEEEARRRKDDLEKEHLERRAALRWTFSKKSTADERKLFLDWWDERMKIEHNGATLYSVDWKKVDAEIKKWDDKAHKVNLKHRAEDRNRIEELQIEYNKMLKKALMEDRPVEKFAEELRKNLDELALFNTSIPNVANERMLNVLDIVRESYLHGADDIRKSIDEINSSMNWGLSDDQIEVMTARIEAATDQYDDMIRQQAQRIKKRIETSYKLNGADGVSYDDRKNFLMERFSLAGERYGKFDSAGFGGGYLGISSSDRVSWETQKAKVELSKLEMRDLEAQRKKRLALAKDEKERFAINQQFSILEVEKRAEVNELVREQIALQEDMAMKIVEHMNEYEGVARDLMKSYSELGGPIFNSDGTLHGIDAAKMSYNRDNGINQGKSKYVVYKGDGTYETKWMTEEQRLVEERDLAAKNARIEATNKALQEWGEKMAKDITDAFQRQFNEQVVERDAEIQVEREKMQLTNDRVKAQIDSEKLYTQAFKSELANRMEAMMDFVDGLQSLYEGSVGKGLFDKDGVADKIATGVQNIADASKAAVEKNIKSGAVVDWNAMGLSESASVSVGRDGLANWGGNDTGSSNFSAVPADSYPVGIVGMPDFSEFAAKELEAYNAMRERMVESTIESNTAMERSQKSTMASMIQSANLYGITYNTVMNDNLSATQKTGMIMLQSVSQMFMSMTSLMGSAMISQLTAKTAETTGEVALDQTAGIARLFKDHNFWVAMGLTAALTGLLGAGMALANRKMQKSKAEIAAATGASQGRLTTGMLTYASGKYNDDKKRKEGRMASGMVTFADGYVSGQNYEVDGADGKSYDAKFVGRVSDMGTGIKRGTHFGIFSEVKPEMVIDGDTTALMHSKYPMLESAIMKLHRTGSLNMSDMIALNYSGISRTIDTLSRSGALGGRMGGFRMPTFAEGRYPDMADVDMGGMTGADGMGQNGNLQMQQLTDTLALLQQTLAGGINATMSTHDASRKLAKQKRWEERYGVKN